MRKKRDKYKNQTGYKPGKKAFFINRERKEVTDKDIYQIGQWQSP